MSDILYNPFGPVNHTGYRKISSEYSNTLLVAYNHYLESPVVEGKVEIPVFAKDSFVDIQSDNFAFDYVYIPLLDCGRYSEYATPQASIKNFFNSDRDTLLRISAKVKEEERHYYIIRGSIFNDCLIPLIMSSYVFNYSENGIIRATEKKVTINPLCVVDKEDPVSKIIMTRLLPAAIDWGVTIEIGKSSLNLYDANIPSTGITDEDLRKIALDSLDYVTIAV
jgi:hypothetical protein